MAPEVGLEPTTLRLQPKGKAWSTYVINGIERSTQENSESLWRTTGPNSGPNRFCKPDRGRTYPKVRE